MVWDDGLILHFQSIVGGMASSELCHADASGWWGIVLHIVVGLSYPQTRAVVLSLKS